MTTRRIVLVVAAVLLFAAGGTVLYFALAGEDPGVTACKRAADRAAAGKTSDASSTEELKMLMDSKHADLRAVGRELDELTQKGGGLVQMVGASQRLIAACGAHDVVISPGR